MTNRATPWQSGLSNFPDQQSNCLANIHLPGNLGQSYLWFLDSPFPTPLQNLPNSRHEPVPDTNLQTGQVNAHILRSGACDDMRVWNARALSLSVLRSLQNNKNLVLMKSLVCSAFPPPPTHTHTWIGLYAVVSGIGEMEQVMHSIEDLIAGTRQVIVSYGMVSTTPSMTAPTTRNVG